MADYWKSTPKYWCKFCQLFVRDTKIEKQQHEATGKHQGAVQRSLRNLHKDKERQERDKQRAKDEVTRLNGLVSSSAVVPVTSNSTFSSMKSTATPAKPRQRTVQDVKQNAAALAAMGVAIPEDYRGEIAMAGEWHTVSKSHVMSSHQDSEQLAATLPPMKGIRKRKAGSDEEEDAQVSVQKKRWGSTYKKAFGPDSHIDELDSLFPAHNVKLDTAKSLDRHQLDSKEDVCLKEEELGDTELAPSDVAMKVEQPIKKEANDTTDHTPPNPDVLFRKRKTKVKPK